MIPAKITEALKNIRLVISEKDNVDVYRDAATCALDFLNEYVSDEVENLNLVPEKVSSETYEIIYDTINALENIWILDIYKKMSVPNIPYTNKRLHTPFEESYALLNRRK